MSKQATKAELLAVLEAIDDSDQLDHYSVSNYGDGRYKCAGVPDCHACNVRHLLGRPLYDGEPDDDEQP